MARGDNLFRQWEMIKVLQAHRFGVSTNEIAVRLECNKRTVQRDLRELRKRGQIEFIGPTKTGYWVKIR